ncbi:hypothetical protein DPMN_146206 [Dreissena polymorpha]|uniref:Uncharacterized protein n=1 Tax=Dreissena polymorpha TaxID=45954 RepID=A0A9D4FBC7_DREPO|nr:hypothetical protein DPMN_146206 [Dreissena polymorpha]
MRATTGSRERGPQRTSGPEVIRAGNHASVRVLVRLRQKPGRSCASVVCGWWGVGGTHNDMLQ